ncbi:MAG: flagellin [Alphaproteobacteria bacterium]|nr:flagellin [Alphaproteobacteria bacterium]
MSDISANTNIGAMASRRYMERNSRMASIATQELASGFVTFDPSRKPSEAAIGARLEAKISNLAQATKNANQLIALIQMGVGTLETMQTVITRMQGLSGQSNNDAIDDNGRAMLDQEYQQLLAQITNLATYTRWGSQQLFNGSAASNAASGAVTEAFSVTAVTNAFANAYDATNTQGSIDGIVTGATVKANGALYDVTVTFEDGKVFTNTVAAPVVSGSLVLYNAKDHGSTLAFTYDSAVSAFDGTAATFQTNLRSHLGVGTGNASRGTSGSIAMYTGATLTAGAAAAAGTWSMNYTVSGTNGTFSISNGNTVYSTTITAGAALTQTVNVGAFSIALANFNGSATLGQAGTTVTTATTLTMSGQIEETSTDTLSITFRSASAASLNLSGTNVASKSNAAAADTALKAAAATVSNFIAELGGKRSQLDFQVDSLKISSQNQAAAKSTYTDTNIAEATDRLTKFKALSSMSSAVFAQAIQDTSKLAQLLERL